jgi:succinyl-CoA synthetase alpha subunit
MKVTLKLKNEDLFYFAVYKKMEDAMTKHRDADVLVNFASLRSAYESTIETMNYPQVTTKIYHSFINHRFIYNG